MKMCVVVFGTVATTFIIAYLIGDFNYHTHVLIGDQYQHIIFTAITVIYIGSIISAILLGYFVVRIGLIIYHSRQLKPTK